MLVALITQLRLNVKLKKYQYVLNKTLEENVRYVSENEMCRNSTFSYFAGISTYKSSLTSGNTELLSICFYLNTVRKNDFFIRHPLR